MNAVMITGISGAGKTTIAAVLAHRGLVSIDADDDPLLARSVDLAGHVVEDPATPDFAWLARHSWAWNPDRLDELIRAAAPATLYVCGGAANELELADRFTQIFLLEMDESTMLARLDAPGRDNDWGRIGDTREYLRRRLQEYQDRLRAFGAIPVDARQPLDHVVDAILSHTLAGSAASVAGSAASRASKPGKQPGRPARPQKPPVSTPDVVVRDYSPADYSACRMLWVELTEHHRRIYEDPSIGGDDPGGAFDDYLAASGRVASWVAELDGRVVGLTGLFDRGTSGEVEPVVVTERLRSRGVGRLLIERVVTEAVARGYDYLAIRPVARNVRAIRRFYDAGFQTLGGHIDLTMDLADRHHRWLEGAPLADLDFRY